jgi:hypothetical protein
MDAAKADGVFAAMWGADSPRIIQQYVEYGLSKKMPLFGIASFTSEELLGDMPPAAAGILSAYTYCGTLDTPENKKFISDYQSRYRRCPDPISTWVHGGQDGHPGDQGHQRTGGGPRRIHQCAFQGAAQRSHGHDELRRAPWHRGRLYVLTVEKAAMDDCRIAAGSEFRR